MATTTADELALLRAVAADPACDTARGALAASLAAWVRGQAAGGGA